MGYLPTSLLAPAQAAKFLALYSAADRKKEKWGVLLLLGAPPETALT